MLVKKKLFAAELPSVVIISALKLEQAFGDGFRDSEHRGWSRVGLGIAFDLPDRTSAYSGPKA